jgi:hypothetical protein
MSSGDIVVSLAVAGSLLKEWREHLVEHSNYWLVLMADSLLLPDWSLELVRCQQATYMLVTPVTHKLTVAVSLHTTFTGLLQYL